MFNFIANYKKYGPNPSTHDILKFVAIVIMIVDHAGLFFFPDNLMWRAIGRTGFPIWFFLAGYAKPAKMGSEIYILGALMVALSTTAYNGVFPVAALFSIIICRYFIARVSRSQWSKWQSIFYIIGLALLLAPSLYMFEYGTLALMFALLGYLVKTQPGSIDTKITAVLTTVIFLAVMSTLFKFSILENGVMYLGTAVVVVYLSTFKVQFYEVKRCPALANAAMFLARNSLYIYFIHYTVFECIEWIMHPENHLVFKWI